ncbi:MAG: amidohydrolase, partial [Bacteroidota bacterium]
QVPAPQTIIAQHVDPYIPIGYVGVRSGMYMASADEVRITVRGTGGHAAAPHVIGPDTVLTASQIVVALQHLISRNCPPDVPSVLSIGRFIADGAHNVIPDTVKLWGTFRAMDETWRFRAHERIRDVVAHTAATYGAEAEVEIKVGYPALYNHEAPTAFVRQAAVDYVGADRVVDLDRWFAAEDFAWYLREKPGCFYRLGVRNEAEGIVHGLHTPQFTIDEEALRLGPGFMAYLTLEAVRQGADIGLSVGEG